MKRPAVTLVNYSSSDEDLEEDLPVKQKAQSAPKKRKLPPISSSIVPDGPVDNPTLHQGRIRTTPHVEGQFAAHVYVSLPLGQHTLLHELVKDILRDTRKEVPTLRDIWPEGDATTRPELHISLSRPIFLRAHQREDLRRAVKNIAKTHKAFVGSFATLAELINDEKTRTFLTLEVGAGYHELRSLADALTPSLRAIRQQEYYVNPRFHASIGWALLQNERRASAPQPVNFDSICTHHISSEDLGLPLSPCTTETSRESFPTIANLPPNVINDLNERYSDQLSSPKVGRFEVESISLKIGKDVSSWRLIGV